MSSPWKDFFFSIHHRCSLPFTHPWIEKEVNVLVEQGLVLLVPSTEVLQELVSQFHDLLHSNILALGKPSRSYYCIQLLLFFCFFNLLHQEGRNRPLHFQKQTLWDTTDAIRLTLYSSRSHHILILMRYLRQQNFLIGNLTFSYGIWSSSSTTVWAPMFLSSLCCCFLLFFPDAPSCTHNLLSLNRIFTEGEWKRVSFSRMCWSSLFSLAFCD